MADTSFTFFLMTEKGYEVLKAVVERFGAGVADKVVGARDLSTENDYYEEISAFCRQSGIAFFDRKEKVEVTTLYSVAISWRWLIPGADNTTLIVLHDSILPKYRGFAPLVNSLINGETAIGVTALFATDEYDCGHIIGQRSTNIKYPITIKQAIERVSKLYAELVTDVINKMRGGQVAAEPQNEQEASYSIWRDEDDYEIDWNKDAAYIRRFIDAVGYPYKGARTFDGEKQCRVTGAVELPDVKVENRHAGKVIFVKDGCPVVICGRGLLKITAMNDAEGNQLLPLKKFRTRFSTNANSF